MKLYTFKWKDYYRIRVANVSGTPWFAGVDIARALGLTPKYSVVRHVSDTNKKVVQVSHGRRVYDVVLINLDGVNELVKRVRLKQLNVKYINEFIEWVNDAATVIPSLKSEADSNLEDLCVDAQATEPDEPMKQQEDAEEQMDSKGIVQVFENEEFGKLRTVEIDGEPWLVGKDVAVILGYKNPQEAIRGHVDDEDKGVSEILTPGGKQMMPVINESGVYALVFGSKLPKAKDFKRWVTKEVLPSIRKTGSYQSQGCSKSEMEYRDLTEAQKSLIKNQQELIEAQRQVLAVANKCVETALYAKPIKEEKPVKDAKSTTTSKARKSKKVKESLEETVESENCRVKLREMIKVYASISNLTCAAGWVTLRRIMDKQYGIGKGMTEMKKELGWKKNPTLPDYLSYSNQFPIAFNVVDAMISNHPIATPA